MDNQKPVVDTTAVGFDPFPPRKENQRAKHPKIPTSSPNQRRRTPILLLKDTSGPEIYDGAWLFDQGREESTTPKGQKRLRVRGTIVPNSGEVGVREQRGNALN